VIPDTPLRQTGVGEFVIKWLAPILLLLASSVVWSNHVRAGFHADDLHIVVKNRAIRSLNNVPRFFVQPRAFSSEPEFADYKPLLLTDLALDAAISSAAVDPALASALQPLIFQLDTLIWFAALAASLYLLFTLVPGTSHEVALGACALVLLHPVAAETVNYISQRGQIMSALGVTLALALWIVWPRRLPKTLGIDMDRVPQTWWQFKLRENGARWENNYRRFLRMPIPFYFIPLAPALFADPSAAFFVALAFSYMWIYDRKYGYFHLFPPAAICGAYWIVQTAVVWNSSTIFRVPAFSYWISQPWVALRYLWDFFVPFGVNADTGYQPLLRFPLFWPGILAALAGCAGVAGLCRVAMKLRRRKEWQGVAFGICWFLIALLPTALVPQRTVEANARMFFALAGAAFAAANLAGIGWKRLCAMPWNERQRLIGASACGLAVLVVAGTLGWLTWERNDVWETDKSLWLDVATRSPHNGRGLINYASVLATEDDEVNSLAYLKRAVAYANDDPQLQLQLANGFDRINRDQDAEKHFRRAIQLAPAYAAANSGYGRWLVAHLRGTEGFAYASKGRALNATDLVSRHALMEICSQRADWANVTRIAREALAIDPDDEDGKRSMTVAQASIDQLVKAEEETKDSPTVDDFLKLSVLYYHAKRYEDCLRAAKSAVQLNPKLAEGYANMATALHSLGRDDEAIPNLREVVRLRPDLEFAKVDLRILLEKQAADPGSKKRLL
jgi:tetratricopeptide (TPR) repeat protein